MVLYSLLYIVVMEELLKLFKERLEHLKTNKESAVNDAKIVEISMAIYEIQSMLLKQLDK